MAAISASGVIFESGPAATLWPDGGAAAVHGRRRTLHLVLPEMAWGVQKIVISPGLFASVAESSTAAHWPPWPVEETRPTAGRRGGLLPEGISRIAGPSTTSVVSVAAVNQNGISRPRRAGCMAERIAGGRGAGNCSRGKRTLDVLDDGDLPSPLRVTQVFGEVCETGDEKRRRVDGSPGRPDTSGCPHQRRDIRPWWTSAVGAGVAGSQFRDVSGSRPVCQADFGSPARKVLAIAVGAAEAGRWSSSSLQADCG